MHCLREHACWKNFIGEKFRKTENEVVPPSTHSPVLDR
jgi:hypothetical protein